MFLEMMFFRLWKSGLRVQWWQPGAGYLREWPVHRRIRHRARHPAAHLPGCGDQADALKAKGIDSIVCVSVNDPFVMDAWGKANNADGKVTMPADKNGDFTRATGLAVDLGDFGLGERTQRFSMIVDDGAVTAIAVEENVLEHGISSAEAMPGQV